MRRRLLQSVLGVGMLVAWPGCAEKPVEVTYDPPLEMSALAPALPAPDNAYMMLNSVETAGRFACPLAVAKLANDPLAGTRELTLQTTCPEEEAQWTERFRGVSAIRELVFLRPLDIKTYISQYTGLFAAARRLDVPLLLVYAPNGYGPNSAQVLGVLYDTATEQPLATLHAAARYLNEEGLETSPDFEKGDHRDTDARYRAQRAFEGHALACVRDLIEHDAPSPTTQPHRWQKPLIERWWLRSRR